MSILLELKIIMAHLRIPLLSQKCTTRAREHATRKNSENVACFLCTVVGSRLDRTVFRLGHSPTQAVYCASHAMHMA